MTKPAVKFFMHQGGEEKPKPPASWNLEEGQRKVEECIKPAVPYHQPPPPPVVLVAGQASIPLLCLPPPPPPTPGTSGHTTYFQFFLLDRREKAKGGCFQGGMEILEWSLPMYGLNSAQSSNSGVGGGRDTLFFRDILASLLESRQDPQSGRKNRKEIEDLKLI